MYSIPFCTCILTGQIWTSHCDEELNFKGFFGRTDFWNFAFQRDQQVDITINPGDTLKVELRHHLSLLDHLGDSKRSEDEMCLVFLFTTPKKKRPHLIAGE
jgi:hypothetical protein